MPGNPFPDAVQARQLHKSASREYLISHPRSFRHVFWTQGARGAPYGAQGARTSITGIREFATPGYARIVFILNRESFNFKSGVLKKPPRIFLDIPRGRLERDVHIPKFAPGASIVSRLRFGKPRKKQPAPRDRHREKQTTSDTGFSPCRVRSESWWTYGPESRAYRNPHKRKRASARNPKNRVAR